MLLAYQACSVYRAVAYPAGRPENTDSSCRHGRRLRVFENRVLRVIFGTRKDEVTGKWRKIHIEKLNDLYCSPNIVRVIQSRRMR